MGDPSAMLAAEETAEEVHKKELKKEELARKRRLAADQRTEDLKRAAVVRLIVTHPVLNRTSGRKMLKRAAVVRLILVNGPHCIEHDLSVIINNVY